MGPCTLGVLCRGSDSKLHEEEYQLATPQLQGKEISNVLHDGVGGGSLIQQQARVFLGGEGEGDAGLDMSSADEG